jgi:hypothetical protein
MDTTTSPRRAGLIRTGDNIQGIGTVRAVTPGPGHLTVNVTTDDGTRQLGRHDTVRVVKAVKG